MIMKIITANTWFSRFLGLMGKKDFGDILVIVMPFQSRMNGIHTCFMRFPIDVYFLDENGVLVDKSLNVKPWNLGVYPKEPAKYIIEVKSGNQFSLDEVRKELGLKI